MPLVLFPRDQRGPKDVTVGRELVYLYPRGG
jgi:hypothetical protein